MKSLLTKAEKLRQEQSRNREAVIRLNKLDELSDEQRSELNTATDRLLSVEPEIRSAMTAEAAERSELEAETRARAGDDGLDPETRERNDLARKASVGRMLAGMFSKARIDGPEAELRAAFNCGDNDIPLAALEVPHRDRLRAENRAVTATAATVGVNMGEIAPFVFATSIAGRMGIQIRDVPSGTYSVPRISTAPSTADPLAKGAAADATAGAFTVVSATPKRIAARLSVALEDIAAFGTDAFESALREALQSKLGDSFDNQAINGDGQGANLNGLLSQLTDPAAPAAAVETFDRWAAIGASVIDGLWAASMRDVSMVWNAEAYRQASGVFRGADGPVSAAAYLGRETAGFAASSRMPATAANIATGIAARLGQLGLTRAVLPSWGRISVDDMYSNAAEGQRHFTVSVITGDLLVVQPAAYSQLAARVSV